jgi:REP element-mobilizing transposase RayT
MTQARHKLVDPTQAGTYHCINRCVRRSWICGDDDYTGKSFEHRKPWVEARILELGAIFACGIYSWAVMSNHLHLVVHMSPATARDWQADEVAARWVKLYPAQNAEACAQKIAAISENAELVAEYRSRLANLSWLMKSLSEPIARKANAEDQVTGRFWEGRFKCQALLSEKSQLAAMAYVDLNPVRAKIATGVSNSRYTSIKLRNRQIQKSTDKASQPLMPLIGIRSFNVPRITEADYIELVDFTGRQWHPGKKGKIDAKEPKALTKLGLDKNHWTTRVKGIGSGYWRVVGEVEELIDKAKEMAQRTLFGTGFARILSKI